ncbi:response regulator [Marinicella meishanensis]|uniref:response regulator n=1 Tax=Marinicella meishanensis TaxID=2873263 RepID=UPI001CC10BF0|nr:response regulator [Marinicella sp. NBU2979]
MAENNIQVVRTIAQDQTGMIWLGSAFDGLYYYDGHLARKQPLDPDKPNLGVLKMRSDWDQNLWFITDSEHVYQQHSGQFIPRFNSQEVVGETRWTDIGFKDHDQLILLSEHALVWVDLKEQRILKTAHTKEHGALRWIKSINHQWFVGSSAGLFILEEPTAMLKSVLPDTWQGPVNDLLLLNTGQLMLAADNGTWMLHDRQKNSSSISAVLTHKSLTLVADQIGMAYIGTLHQGLFRLDPQTKHLTQFKHDPHNRNAISDPHVLSSFIDQHNNLWLGTFNNGVSHSHLPAQKFGLMDRFSKPLNCALSDVVMGIHADQSALWLGTERGIIKSNWQTGDCTLINHQPDDPDTLVFDFVYGITPMDARNWWVLTAKGVNLLDSQTLKINRLPGALPPINTYFAAPYSTSKTLFGTRDGLYLFDQVQATSHRIKLGKAWLDGVKFYNHTRYQNEWIFNTSNGLYVMDQPTTLKPLKVINDQLPNLDVTSVLTHLDGLFVAVNNHGLMHFSRQGELLQHHKFTDDQNDMVTIYSQEVKGDEMWLGTSRGLIQLNPKNHSHVLFQEPDGLQSNFFLLSSSHRHLDGSLIFGGRKGLNHFVPEQVMTKQQPLPVALTAFKLFSSTVQPGNQVHNFTLNQPINELQVLNLGHQESVFGFEFNAFDYNQSKKITYAHRLVGFDPKWYEADAYNRQVSYTNIDPGEYWFEVKSQLPNQATFGPVKSIKLKIHPAPWLTWWAKTTYVVLFFSVLGWLVHRKISANAKLAQLLQTEVDEKTRELNTQKVMVESLLAKKNELFSHISHEFRTPLTLILGPINELINKSASRSSLSSLKLINKNANRLLSLVEQLLQIAKVSSFDKVQFHQQKTAEAVMSIIESFQHVAENKHISLILENNEDALITVTDQCLDAILGNLVSNAIKYSPTHSTIKVSALIENNQFLLRVKDQGPGLSREQQSEVFKMFNRLDQHAQVDGVGIGLAVVDEMVKINHGQILINSDLGHGAEFCIQFPLSDEHELAAQPYATGSLLSQLTKDAIDPEMATVTDPNNDPLVSGKDTILVIEDNHDMRRFIVGILQEQYHCLEAENGQVGINQATEFIPDMVVCDVMMPLMDGFGVCRAIRSDEKTSHIPLLLLTALNDKSNRIKGWQENIDSYMTKPFDRDELLIRIENIISIRNILKKKASILLDQGQANRIKLPKKDQEFVDKLNTIIEENFSDPLLNRSKMASQMSVSDRQLQRKLKALIDQNPMDYLRGYRLTKAKNLLADGLQVSQVSDECGFNSLSYFSYCFKAQFNQTPKQYKQSLIG